MLDKIFYLKRNPSNESVSYFPMELFPNIEQVDFSVDSTASVLHMHYPIQTKCTENSIEAILPPQDIARMLNISCDTPIILFDSVMYGTINGQYRPLEYFKSYYRTDQLRFGFTQYHDRHY